MPDRGKTAAGGDHKAEPLSEVQTAAFNTCPLRFTARQGADRGAGEAQAYGDPTKDAPGGNKVTVSFADLSKEDHGGNTTSTLGGSSTGFIANSNVVIDSKLSGTDLDATVGHEGSHVADAQDVVKSIGQDATGQFKVGQDITQYQSEQRAYGVSDSILRSENSSEKFACGVSSCVLGKGLALPAQIPAEVDRIILNNYKSSVNQQPLSPSNQS